MRIIAFLVLSTILMTSCNNKSTSDEELDQFAKEAYQNQFADDSTIVWNYHSTYNKIAGDSSYHAEIYTKKKLQFFSPYNGGSDVVIHVRRDEQDNNVFITIAPGMFVTHSSGGKIRAKFGASKALVFSTSMSSDNSDDTLFIDDADKFINLIKSNDSLILELEFYKEGVRQVEYNISKFKWDH